jgi:hypothetical protein
MDKSQMMPFFGNGGAARDPSHPNSVGGVAKRYRQIIFANLGANKKC